MATNYPLPPWLHPQDVTGAFIQAQHMRAQMEMQQRQLAQQQQLAAMETQVKHEQNQREYMVEQQRMAVEQAIKQQQIDLQRQAVAQQQQRIQVATDQAARQYAAMQGYQAELAAGADPLQTILKYGPAMGHQSSAEAAGIRASQMALRNIQPNIQTDPETGQRYSVNPMTGHIQIFKTAPEDKLSQKEILRGKLAQAGLLSRMIPKDADMIAAMSPADRQKVTDAQGQLSNLNNEIQGMLNPQSDLTDSELEDMIGFGPDSGTADETEGEQQ